jgi:hypothetical protein
MFTNLLGEIICMQSASNILLVRPAAFGYNSETEESNTFQHATKVSKKLIHEKAATEFDSFANMLRQKAVNVLIVNDTVSPPKPDAIFPNNWISCHADGTIIIYPMCAFNRRPERRKEIIDKIKQQFLVKKIIDLSAYETDSRFLEGTGSIIFDRASRVAYACLSPRTNRQLFEELASLLNYTAVCFYAHDGAGKEIYHTNVMMCITEKFSTICLSSISSKQERQFVAALLAATGHEIIDISIEQMNQFAGNMLALKNNAGSNLLALSQTAFESLTAYQKTTMEQYCELVPLPIPTIETIGGGSARCMIAEIFLPKLDIAL